MKIPALIFSCVLVVLVSCNKDESVANTSIIGTWELRQAYGEGPVIKFAAGNGTTLTFTATGYEIHDSGVLVKSGSYTIVKDDSASFYTCMMYAAGEYENCIIYDNDATRKEYFEIKGNTLTTVTGCFALDSGVFYDYEKLQ